MSSVSRVSFDRVADVYDWTRRLPDDVLYKTVDVLTKLLGNCRMILDAGSGTGRFSLPLQEAGFSVIGVDIARKMLERALSKGLRFPIQADVVCLPFSDNAFDAVIVCNLLHLLSHWKEALKEMARVTRGPLLAIDESMSKDAVWEAYGKLLKRRGWNYRKRGLTPAELSTVKGCKEVQVISKVKREKADRLLEAINERSFSSQWETPLKIHTDAMKVLWREFQGKTIDKQYNIRIFVWETSSF